MAFEEVERLPFGDREFLTKQGVSVDDASNQNLQRLEVPLQAFCERYQNETPTLAVAREIFPSVVTLRSSLVTAEGDGAHPKQQTHAWDRLADAAAILSRQADLLSDSTSLALLRKILVQAAWHQDPEPTPEDEERFCCHPAYGRPAPRIVAAAGLVRLSCFAEGADETVRQSIVALARDPVPAARFEVALRLHALRRHHEALMWQLLEQYASAEMNRGVLQGIVHGPLMPLSHYYPDRIFVIAAQIFQRVGTESGTAGVRRGCAALAAQLFLKHAHGGAGELVREIVARPAEKSEEAAEVIASLRPAYTVGTIEPRQPLQDAIRLRAWELMEVTLQAAVVALRDTLQRPQFPSGPATDQEGEQQRLAELVCQCARELSVVSGASETDRGASKEAEAGENASLRLLMKERFYREAQTVLDLFLAAAQLGHTRATHEIVQVLAHLAPADPRGILLRIRDLLQAATSGGYQHESLATDRVVTFAERYIADYRDVLRNTPVCLTALREILEHFILAGWPRAIRLTYRLSDIFR
jgi:hypothetical protein